jgi:hypothetical protein
VVGFWLMRTLVVPHPEMAVRGQVFQMFQVVHFLWPPFLFGGIYRYRRGSVQSAMDVLVNNLPYREG